MEQAVLKAGGLDLDMLGKLEAALKGAAGNALVQKSGLGFSASSRLPLTVSTRSFTSTARSFSAKPATARVTR